MIGLQLLAWLSAVLAVQAFSPSMSATGLKPSVKDTKAALLRVFGESSATLRPQTVKTTDQKLADGVAYDRVLASPATLAPLRDGIRLYGSAGAVKFKEDTGSQLRFSVNSVYTDLFLGETKAPWELSREELVMEGTFQSPLTSWLYERGWRQAFVSNGFPGIDKEFDEVAAFFQPLEQADGSTVVLDLSCGSGLMTRKLVRSRRYSRVIGADLSPAMLGETARRFDAEKLQRPELIRCDVTRLPVVSSSVDGIHAGAALHCWSKLELALQEVYRALKPGGRFYASTFLVNASINSAIRGGATGFHFFTLPELEQLMTQAGFEQVSVKQSGRACAIVKCVKAGATG